MAKNWSVSTIGDLSGKQIIVTGGNSGLGLESIKVLAQKGANIIMACRSLDKGEKAKQEVLKVAPNASIDIMQLDLMDLSSIKSFAAAFNEQYPKLDILLNNAGIMMVPYRTTKDGFESQNGTNHLGHFALTGLLLEKLKNTPKSRVVTVSSIAHKRGNMNFDNLFYEGGKGYSPMTAYARSKLCNLLFTYELQRKFAQHNIDCISVAAHPGVSQTNLGKHLEGRLIFKIILPVFKFFFMHEPAKGALPQIRASVDEGVKGSDYYGPGGFREMKGDPIRVISTKNAQNEEYAKKLWAISEKLTGITYNF